MQRLGGGDSVKKEETLSASDKLKKKLNAYKNK